MPRSRILVALSAQINASSGVTLTLVGVGPSLVTFCVNRDSIVDSAVALTLSQLGHTYFAETCFETAVEERSDLVLITVPAIPTI